MQTKRPNFLFILSDDQGYWSLGSYGNQEVHSPNLDHLAQEGVCFDSFYCASPVCSPARASILTGMMPSAHGVLDWLGGGAVNKEDYKDIMLPRQLILDNLADGIDPDSLDPDAQSLPFSLTRNYQLYMGNEKSPIQYLQASTYTEHLAQAGYRCGIAGKWHLGAGNLPQAGFSFWSVVPRGGTPYRMPDWISNGEIHIGTQYVTDLITDEAIRFLDEGRDEDAPFYLSVHYTAPHDPWRKIDQPEDIWAEYEGCPFQSVPREPLHKNQVSRRPIPHSKEQFREMIQAYYASITAMDQNIGRLLDHLRETGQLENTIVVFTADNGMNFGHHGIWGKGNGTYPQNLYETSTRIPFLMWNPHYMSQGIRVKTPLSHYDIYQTLLDYAGVEERDSSRPGRSFVDILHGGDGACGDRSVVVCDEYGPVRMIRRGAMKLIWCYLDNTGELYDLEKDPNEQQDLIHLPEYREIAMQLKEAMETWFSRYIKPEFDALQYPVNGEGQMRKAGEWYTGERVFVTQKGDEIPCPASLRKH